MFRKRCRSSWGCSDHKLRQWIGQCKYNYRSYHTFPNHCKLMRCCRLKYIRR